MCFVTQLNYTMLGALAFVPNDQFRMPILPGKQFTHFILERIY